MSPHLSAAWTAEVAEVLGALPPEEGGFTGRVRWTVTKAPGGDHTSTWQWEDGVVRSVQEDGKGTAADIELTMAYPDHRTLVRGEVTPAVAFMRGRLKAAGHSGSVLALLERTHQPAFAEAWAEVGRRTDWDTPAG